MYCSIAMLHAEWEQLALVRGRISRPMGRGSIGTMACREAIAKRIWEDGVNACNPSRQGAIWVLILQTEVVDRSVDMLLVAVRTDNSKRGC